jgi:hypothetical protein
VRQADGVTSGGNAGPGDRRRLASGHDVGPYRLVEPLGRGGMGEVWRADDPTGAAGGAPRPVAIKLLDPALAADPAVRARFAREVAALRKVDNPFVAPLLDADADAPVPWLASAYVAGPTLADHVARHGPLAEAPLRALGAALAEALASIHAAGVVHRDLTPRNIVLGPDGPRVVDFGIAWFPGAVPVTQAGSAVGTPTWMAPERLASGEATAAGDVWSWGAVMAYAGQGPGRLPGWLAPWVRAATGTDPGARPTAAELRAAMAPGPAGTTVEAADALAEVTRELTRSREPTRDTAATRVFDTGARPRPPAAGVAGRRLGSWGSAVAVVGVAAVVGAVTGLLGSVIVASVLVLVALALQFRRDRPGHARPVPPTWAVALASPVALGMGLVRTFGPVPGTVALVVLVVLFAILTDIVT